MFRYPDQSSLSSRGAGHAVNCRLQQRNPCRRLNTRETLATLARHSLVTLLTLPSVSMQAAAHQCLILQPAAYHFHSRCNCPGVDKSFSSTVSLGGGQGELFTLSLIVSRLVTKAGAERPFALEIKQIKTES